MNCCLYMETDAPPQIIGSFSQAYCFPRAVAYLDGGKINVKGMVRCPVSRPTCACS